MLNETKRSTDRKYPAKNKNVVQHSKKIVSKHLHPVLIGLVMNFFAFKGAQQYNVNIELQHATTSMKMKQLELNSP